MVTVPSRGQSPGGAACSWYCPGPAGCHEKVPSGPTGISWTDAADWTELTKREIGLDGAGSQIPRIRRRGAVTFFTG